MFSTLQQCTCVTTCPLHFWLLYRMSKYFIVKFRQYVQYVSSVSKGCSSLAILGRWREKATNSPQSNVPFQLVSTCCQEVCPFTPKETNIPCRLGFYFSTFQKWVMFNGHGKTKTELSKNQGVLIIYIPVSLYFLS